MKTIMSFGLLGVMYCYPETVIGIVIAVLFIQHLTSKLINGNSVDKGHYSMVNEILNDESSEYYVEDKSKDVKEEPQQKDYRGMSYRDIQQLCREAGIKRVNRRKKILIAALQNV